MVFSSTFIRFGGGSSLESPPPASAPVIGALGAVTKNHSKYVQSVHDTIRTEDLQKVTLLGTSKILREVLSLPDSR